MIFSSPESALKWAYEVSNTPIVKLSSVSRMQGGGRGTGAELTPHDRHAQAALIIKMVGRLSDPAGQECVTAQYGRTLPVANSVLIMRLAACMATGLHDRRAIFQIMQLYFGAKGGYRSVRSILKCGEATAREMQRNIYDALDQIHDRAMCELEDVMARGGLLRAEQCCTI